jgi:hypothetical protein
MASPGSLARTGRRGGHDARRTDERVNATTRGDQ